MFLSLLSFKAKSDIMELIIAGQAEKRQKMKKENLRTVSQIRPDQDIIVTKWIGLEATTILAKEKEEELKKRYGIQLDYYAKALEQLTGKTVKEKIVYSFALGKEIMC